MTLLEIDCKALALVEDGRDPFDVEGGEWRGWRYWLGPRYRMNSYCVKLSLTQGVALQKLLEVGSSWQSEFRVSAIRVQTYHCQGLWITAAVGYPCNGSYVPTDE